MEDQITTINADNEPASRKRLFELADTIDLTLVDNSVPKSTFSIFGIEWVNVKQVKGDIVNEGTLETFQRLEPWFVRRETNNLMYGGVPQGRKAEIDHYYFQLSDELKDIFNQESLFWDGFDSSSLLRGFEDPVFYLNDKKIGYVISHEKVGIIFE